MATAKLEVYKLILIDGPKYNQSFRDLFYYKFFSESGRKIDEISDKDIYKAFFERFIKKIDCEDFWDDTVSKKGITAYNTNPEGNDSSGIRFSSYKCIAEGKISGGKYGRPRRKSEKKNKKKTEEVRKTDLITDDFYFMLLTPLSDNVGILLIQSYSDDSVSSVFKKFLKQLLMVDNFRKPVFEVFTPKEMKQDFENGSILKRLTYSSKYIVDHLSNNPEKEIKKSFTIKIEATSNDDSIPLQEVTEWVKRFNDFTFGDEEGSKGLDEFDVKGQMRNVAKNRRLPFEIEDNFEINPVIYLKDVKEVLIDDNGIPDEQSLKKYCLNLLDLIKSEVYLINDSQ